MTLPSTPPGPPPAGPSAADVRRRRALLYAGGCALVALIFLRLTTLSDYSDRLRILWAAVALLWLVLCVAKLRQARRSGQGQPVEEQRAHGRSGQD